jgi:hypothetical protein
MPDKKLLSTPNRPDQLWGPSSLQGNKYRGSFPGVERPGRDVDHPPPTSAEVKNEWSYTSSPQICLNGVDRDNRYLQVTYGPPGHAVLPNVALITLSIIPAVIDTDTGELS